MTKAGVPPEVVAGFGQATASGQLDFNNLTGVGDLGAAILAAVPAQAKAVIEPFIGQIVTGLHEAFSLAVAQTFWIGVGAAIIAAIAAAFMTEHALRTTNVPAPAGQPVAGGPAPATRPSRSPPTRRRRLTPAFPSQHTRTAPVDPTGAVVRPPRVAIRPMDPTPRPVPPRICRRLGTDGAPFEAVLDASELPPGAMRRVTRGDLDVLLAHTPEGIVATDDRCPHMSAPLSIGELEGCIVACPLHDGRLRPGRWWPRPDADDRRSRPGRRLPPDLVAGRPRAKARSAGQEGRGAAADPRSTLPLLPAPHRRRPDRGRAAPRIDVPDGTAPSSSPTTTPTGRQPDFGAASAAVGAFPVGDEGFTEEIGTTARCRVLAALVIDIDIIPCRGRRARPRHRTPRGLGYVEHVARPDGHGPRGFRAPVGAMSRAHRTCAPAGVPRPAQPPALRDHLRTHPGPSSHEYGASRSDEDRRLRSSYIEGKTAPPSRLRRAVSRGRPGDS